MPLDTAQPKPETSKASDKRERSREKLKLLQKVRAAVKARDQGRCRVCNSRQGVEVHHIRFRSKGGGHTDSNMACLCQECHYAVHSYRLALSGDANGTLQVKWLA